MLFKNIIGVNIIFVITLFSLSEINAQYNNDSLNYFKSKLKHIDEIPTDSTLYYFDKLIEREPLKQKANLMRKKAAFLIDKNLYKAAGRVLAEALEVAKDNNFRYVEGRIYQVMGYLQFCLNNNLKAYKNLLLAKDIYIELNEESHLNNVISNMATLLAEEGENLQEAERLFYQSLQYYREKKDTTNIIISTINIANILQKSNKIEESEKMFQELLEHPGLKKPLESLVNYNIADTKKSMKKYAEAEEYIDRAIGLSEEIGDEIQLIDLYLFKANLEINKTNYKEALYYLNKSLKTTIKIEDLPFQEELLKKILEVNIKAKKFSVVDSLFQEIEVVQDTLSNRERLNSFKEVYLENQIDQKEKEMVEQYIDLMKEKGRKKLYFILALSGGLTIMLLVFLFFLYKKNNQKSMYLMKQKAKIKEVEQESRKKDELIRTAKIENELKQKKRELLQSLLFINKRKEKLKMTAKKIDKIATNSVITKDHLLNLKSYIIEKSKELDSAENVQQRIVNTHKTFFNNLLNDFPTLTETELKILAYLRVGLTTKEIAVTQNVSIDAVRKMRYRTRKKLQLDSKLSLERFILKYH